MRGRIAAVAAGVVLGIGAAVAPAWAVSPGDVEIVDPLGVLDRDRVEEFAEDLDFHQAADVVVLVVDDGTSENLNVKVRDLAFAEHQDWLSPDQQYWRDGILIWAVDPYARQVGTYFGENMDFSDSSQSDVQESSKDDYRHGRWTDGTLAALDTMASVVNRPWYLAPGTWIAGAIGAGVAGLGGLVVKGRNRQIRGQYEEARALYGDVTTNLDELDINAGTIPADSTFGAKVLEEYRAFGETHRRATELDNELREVEPKHFYRPAVSKKVRMFSDRVEQADRITDLIENCSAILNKSATWREAWDREVRPVQDDIDNASELVQKVPELADSTTANALMGAANTASGELERLTAALTADEISPDDALAGLDKIAGDLADTAEQHANAMIAHYARSKSEEHRMRRSMRSWRDTSDYDSGRNYVRSTSSSSLNSVTALTFGYLSAQSAIDSSRSSSSSSSSSGSSSFSGSGSSSSF